MKTEHKLIIVEGLPCSGKSTTGRYIADALGMTYFDEGTGVRLPQAVRAGRVSGRRQRKDHSCG